MRKLELVAEKFAGEPVRCLGRENGTQYADGGWDFKEYFETQGKQHIVVEFWHTTGESYARKSDKVLW